MKRKIKRKPIIISIVVIVLLLAAFVLPRMFRPAKNLTDTQVQYTTLEKTDIVDSINISGTVISAFSTNVYTNLTYRISQVNVKEGDVVKKGDTLAILDTSGLEKDIEQATYTLNASEKSAAIDLENKKRAYDNAVYLYNNGLNTEIVNAQTAVTAAQIALSSAQSTYDLNKLLYQSGEISNQEYINSQSALTNAQASYDQASAALANAKISVSQNLKRAENDYEASLAASQNKSQRTALEKLQDQLKDSVIKAPGDGTVTMVNATVGTVGNGVLFVIEDLSHLKVRTSVKEYDIGKVQLGQKAIIKTDATGNVLMEGVVSSIAPTTPKNASGETVSSGDVSFDMDVDITKGDPALKVGLSARLNVTLSEKNGIYAVPYDAVIQKTDGSNVIYTAQKHGQNYIVSELPVQTGLENDFYIEIKGDGVSDGLIVLNDPSAFTPGSAVNIGG